jgi:chemosensory pili system protein ChpA (sensor histidine kinase/response regulator)
MAMSAQGNFDIAHVGWVKGEIDQELLLTQQYLAQFGFNHADTDQLRFARSHLHLVAGAIRILELHGLARFCGEIEAVIGGLETGATPAEAPTLQLLARSLAAVDHFLDKLLRCDPDVPLRLYPLYRELGLVRGKETSEADLFFPSLDVLPPRGESGPGGASEPPPMPGARARFQRGLLRWLRDASDRSALEEMAEAVSAIEQAQENPSGRAFWWACSGFFDSLRHEGLAVDSSVKQVCGRIDREIRQTIEGRSRPDDVALRQVLWQIARSAPVTSLVTDLQQAYRLKELLPPPPQGAPCERAPPRPPLARMRETLAAAKDAWTRCATGTLDPQAHFRFTGQMERLKHDAEQLGNEALAKLVTVLGTTAAETHTDGEPLDERLALEIATALLMIEGALARSDIPPPDCAERVDAIITRVRHAALGAWDEASVPPLPTPDDAAQCAEKRLLLIHVSREVQANLRRAEEVLDAFFRDPDRPGYLPAVEPLLRQVDGVFSMLALEKPQRLLRRCQELIRRFAEADRPVQRVDMELLAEGLATLGFYVTRLWADQPERDARLIDPVLARLSSVEAPAGVASQVEPAPGLTEPARAATDAELLGVFLDESGQVLDRILAGAGTCRVRPGDVEALTAIRRGFHTLKGSGRMVGLNELGNVAWHLEQVINRWLDEHRPATAELLDLIEEAHDSFAAWIISLKHTGHARIEAGALIEKTAKLGAGTAPPEAASVMIGDAAIPAEQFAIFSEEALQRLRTLRGEVSYLNERPEEAARDDFVLAAHALSEISRGVGLVGIADLAYSLELLLRASIEGSVRIDGIEFVLIDRAVALLGQVLQTVFNRQQLSQSEREAMASLASELHVALSDSFEGFAGRKEIPPSLEEVPTEAAFMTPGPVAKAARERRSIRDDIDPHLVQVFLDEATELIPHVGAELRDWRAHPGDSEAPQHLLRSLHTLKGSARMAGAIRLGELTHTMESRIEAAVERGSISEILIDDLEERFDRLQNAIEHMQTPGRESPAAAEAPAQVRAGAVEKPGQAAFAPPSAPGAPGGPVQAQEFQGRAARLRVRAELVDHLVTQAGEVAIARSRIESEMHALRQSLSELTENVLRLRGHLREIEHQTDTQTQSRPAAPRDDEAADAVDAERLGRFQELTRMMAERVNDVATVQQNLLKHIADSEAALRQQAHMSRELQQQLMRVRAVPFASYAERFYRTVRHTARDLGRNARLEITGAETELDRGVIEKVSAPIEHLLRNAIAHGIEAPATRAARGKPETGAVRLAVRHEGNQVSLALSDDGAGLNLRRIRERAREIGVLGADQDIGDTQAMQLIFAPGISTAGELTEVSGRGIGLDVVRSEITSLGGRVEISSVEGQGTSFTLYLPLTLAVAQVVLAHSGPRNYAFPAAMVEQVRWVKPDVLKSIYEMRQIEFRGQTYPIHYLPRLLGDSQSVPQPRRFSPVVLLHSGVQRVAVHVDEFAANQEVVVKHIGPQLARVPGIEGATVLGNGEVVLIINPVELARQGELLQVAAAPALGGERPAQAAPLALVVDDSLTVRKFTGRLLEREGYRVLTAKDGQDALQQIEDMVPDIILVDADMPRVDGFEFTRHVRSDPRTSGVPIIMITSGTTDKSRIRAQELGVNIYLGKPCQEEELLAHIGALVKQKRPAA